MFDVLVTWNELNFSSLEVATDFRCYLSMYYEFDCWRTIVDIVIQAMVSGPVPLGYVVANAGAVTINNNSEEFERDGDSDAVLDVVLAHAEDHYNRGKRQ